MTASTVPVRRLLPEPAADVDLADAYAVPGGPGRHLRVNMVSSVDGAAAVDGRVGVLTGPVDQELLHLLRWLADVVLVGAGTIRAEGYAPIRLPQRWRARRLAAGQLPEPRLAVLTHSLDLNFGASVFTAATQRPLVITVGDAPAERLAAAAEVADVVVAGRGRVDLRAAVDALVERGMTRILSEGGPRVLAELFAAGLVDELCLAVAPLVTAGDHPRITTGPALEPMPGLDLAHVLTAEQFLFLRYTVRQPVGS